jgi:hypothetical protein
MGCSTCGTGVAGQAPVLAPENFAPQSVPTPAPINNTYYEQAPNGDLSTGGSYNSTVPANNAPSLLNGVSNPQASQRPLLDRFATPNNSQGRSNYQTSSPRQIPDQWQDSPATINMEDKTAQSPVREQWNYSPIRMASYTKPAAVRSIAPRQSVPTQVITTPPRQASQNLNGWVEVN